MKLLLVASTMYMGNQCSHSISPDGCVGGNYVESCFQGVESTLSFNSQDEAAPVS